MEPIRGRTVRLIKLDAEGRPTRTQLYADGSMAGSDHELSHGIRRRWHDDSLWRATHPIGEMIDEAAKRHALQLELLAQQGCLECGDPVAVIEYPPSWSVQMVQVGRYPGEASTTGLEVTEVVRFLCAQHAGHRW